MIRRIRNTLLIFLLLIYLLFEELIWKSAVIPVIRFFSAFHLYRRFLDYVRLRAGRITVLILFTVPFLLGEIIGILSGILAARLFLLSAALLYACKIPLIVVALAILQNGKEKLLTFGWFELSYIWTIKQLDRLHESVLYRQTTLAINQIRTRLKSRSNLTLRMIIRLYRRIRYSIRKTEIRSRPHSIEYPIHPMSILF